MQKSFIEVLSYLWLISWNYFFFKLTVKYGCILIMAYKYKYAYKQIITTPNIIDGYNYDKTWHILHFHLLFEVVWAG